MAFGDFPMEGYGNKDMSTYKNPAGVILNKDLSKVHDVDLEDLKTVEEFVNNSWYDYSGIQKEENNLGAEKQILIILVLNLRTNI
jgi:Ni,Fe-hydrogenase I large subunit